MDHLDHWRLVRVLTVKDAAQLVIGQDPRKYFTGDSRPVAAAIIEAIELGEIKGELIHPALDGIGNIESSVNAESLKAWLETKGIESHFFFPETAPASTSDSEEQAAELENYRRIASEVPHLRSRLSQAEQDNEFLQCWKDRSGPEIDLLRQQLEEANEACAAAQEAAETENKRLSLRIAELEAENAVLKESIEQADELHPSERKSAGQIIAVLASMARVDISKPYAAYEPMSTEAANNKMILPQSKETVKKFFGLAVEYSKQD